MTISNFSCKSSTDCEFDQPAPSAEEDRRSSEGHVLRRLKTIKEDDDKKKADDNDVNE